MLTERPDEVPNDAVFLAPARDRDDFIVVAHLNDLMARSFAYKLAADELVDAAIGQGLPQNIGVAPILFNYRHSIESVLKLIVGQQYLDDRQNINLGNSFTHRLTSLWEPIKAWLQAREVWDEWAEFIDRNIKLLDEMDPESMSFRYVDQRAHVGQDSLAAPAGSSLHQVRLVLGETWTRLDAIHTMRFEEANAEGAAFFSNYKDG